MDDSRLPLPAKIYLFFLGILLLLSVAYSFTARTLRDFLTYIPLWSLVAVGLFANLSISLATAFGRALPKPTFLHFLRILRFAIPLAFIAYGVVVSVRDAYSWLSITKYEVIVVWMALLLGLVLFTLRSNLRFFYGISEVLVGLIVAAYRHIPKTSIWDFDTFLPFLTAGVYLVVRGFDNIQQGLSKNTPDPLVSWLRSIFRSDDVYNIKQPRRFKKLSERMTPRETIRFRLRAKARKRNVEACGK